MKIWFEYCQSLLFDDHKFIGFGIQLQKHRRKEWKGVSIYLTILKWTVTINIVNNYKEYKRIIIDREPIKRYILRMSGKKEF